MNTITTTIITLSLLGLYINLYSRSNLSDPELMSSSWLSKMFTKENHENVNEKLSGEVKKIIQDLELDPKLINSAKNVSPEEIDSLVKSAEEDISLESAPKMYNEVGEKMSEVKDNRILNLGKNVKGGSSTRAYGWVRPSTVDKVDSNGSLSKEDISYKNNYPYKSSELRMKSGDSKALESSNELTATRRYKQDAQVGTIILPNDTSMFDINNTYTERATSIYKTRIGYENKILPDVREINPDLLKERNNMKLNSIDEMPRDIEIKTRPNLVGFKDRVEHMKTHERLYPLDKVDADMKNISRNYNLK
jgi:hypothetical protein